MDLQIDLDHQLNLSSQSLVGESIAVLGIKGSGKTNTAAVLIEELLSGGLPMTIVDIEGEYFGLRERYPILLVGGEHGDVPISLTQAERLAEFSVDHSIPVILDLSEMLPDEMNDFLLAYFNRLWEVNFKARKPYGIVLEEAHEFVPQGTRTPLKQVITRIALRGRKRGFSLMAISQRSAKVDKDILTQAAVVFLHKVIHPVDIRVYQDIVPKGAREVENMIASLTKGQAIVLANNQVSVAQMRLRHTFHGGATPGQGDVLIPLTKIDDTILESLRQSFNGKGGPTSPPVDQPAVNEAQALELQAAKECIAQLEGRITALNAELERLSKAPAGEVVQETVVAPDVPGDFLSPMQITRRTNDQQRRFDYLLKDIMGLPRSSRIMLRYMVEREGSSFSRSVLARKLDLAIDTVRRTQDLEQLDVIVKTGKSDNAQYRAVVSDMFRREYPQLDPGALKDQLLLRLSKTELARR